MISKPERAFCAATPPRAGAPRSRHWSLRLRHCRTRMRNFSTTSWESRPQRTSSSTQPHARAGCTEFLTRWLVGIAQKAPVLILVEDAHWADAATLDFLVAFTERIAQLPVLLLVTHRPNSHRRGPMPSTPRLLCLTLSTAPRGRSFLRQSCATASSRRPWRRRFSKKRAACRYSSKSWLARFSTLRRASGTPRLHWMGL